MPTHYVYDEANKAELNQGDVLQRCEALESLLTEYFPYYQQRKDYCYFMVLTQTCDLVRREGQPCHAPYITIAAVRPVKDVLMMEAQKLQDESLIGTNLVGSDARQSLAMFLESLMDNNKPGFFYLHTDLALGIEQPCCAFLQLAVSFRAQHYERCLEAKIAQLKEPFQAKLGWLIGNMYSRVATTEWNTEKPAEKVGAEASKIIGKMIITVRDEQIREALADLRDNGTLPGMTPDQVKTYVQRKKLIPKLAQFKDRAALTLAELKLIEPLKEKVVDGIWKGEGVKDSIAALLADKGVAETEPVVKDILKIVSGAVRAAMKDDGFPGREKHIKGLIAELMADEVLQSLIKQ